MRYLVIERYRHGPGPVYARVAERGRILADGAAARASDVGP